MEDSHSNTASPRSISPAPTPSQQQLPTRPANPRSSTDPSPAALLQDWLKEKEKSDWARPSSSHRNRSPYSRSHLRSRSSGSSLLSAPLMTRAHSLPNPFTLTPTSADQSPGSLSPNAHQRSPARARSPSKFAEGGASDTYMPPPRSPAWLDSPSSTAGSGIPAIQEDTELDLTPRPHSSYSNPTTTSPMSRSTITSTILANATATRHRRPTSPSPTSHPSSPSLTPQQTQRFNEAFPAPLPLPHNLHHSTSTSSISSFSIPSTPTSARSRSPSISSLDTIEDFPEDEEESEALEAERLERLRLADEREESGSDGEGGTRRKGSLDSVRRPSSGALGTGLGSAAGRKRWSVCGGERRGDLDLETIWED